MPEFSKVFTETINENEQDNFQNSDISISAVLKNCCLYFVLRVCAYIHVCMYVCVCLLQKPEEKN